MIDFLIPGQIQGQVVNFNPASSPQEDGRFSVGTGPVSAQGNQGGTPTIGNFILS